jgi:hypothetical protein
VVYYRLAGGSLFSFALFSLVKDAWGNIGSFLLFSFSGLRDEMHDVVVYRPDHARGVEYISLFSDV